jgi:hypothetical protein
MSSQTNFLSLSLFPSLSLLLVKEDFSFRNLRKSSEPSTAVKQATQEIGGWPEAYTRLPIYMSGAKLQCTKVFLSTLSSLPP